MKIPAERFLMDHDDAQELGAAPSDGLAQQILAAGPQYDLSKIFVMDDGIVYYQADKRLCRAIGMSQNGTFDHSMPYKPKPVKMISRNDALAYYQKRSAELSFELPTKLLKKVFDRYFPPKTPKTKHDPFIAFMDLQFDLEMPDEHRDSLPLSVLNLSDPAIYQALISGVALQQAEGNVSDENAAGLMKAFGADYAKSVKLQKNQKELAEQLRALDNCLSDSTSK
jgi:hypothetical protein